MMGDVTLTEFLLARIADDERIALTASEIISGPAQYGHTLWNFGDQRLEITRRRMLAECKAKRRIVEDADTYVGEFENEEYRTNDDATAGRVAGRARSWREDTLRALALPYADHPDYREEWRV